MDELTDRQEAVAILQDLGLKEYASRTFVALTRLSEGTAKDVSEVSDVPRTRVYDAIAELEHHGLVEVQHSNPRVFRAVPVEEAAETLREQYASRTERLRDVLANLEPVTSGEQDPPDHQIWSLSERTAIDTRVRALLQDADTEIVTVIGHEDLLTEELRELLAAADARGVDIAVSALNAELESSIRNWVEGSEIDPRQHSLGIQTELDISRLFLIDRETVLLGSYSGASGTDRPEERAICGRGTENGLVSFLHVAVQGFRA